MESKNIVISNEEEKIYYTNYIKMISEALLYYEKENSYYWCIWTNWN